MFQGRKFSARFSNDASRYGYLTWSAAQSFIYNEKVREQLYFDSLYNLNFPPIFTLTSAAAFSGAKM